MLERYGKHMEHMLILLECRAFDSMLIIFQVVVLSQEMFHSGISWIEHSFCVLVLSQHMGGTSILARVKGENKS